MNNQEIFDTVALHLIKQGAPGVNDHGDCRYRAGNGHMCAVGVLIPDDKYNAEAERMSPADLIHEGYIDIIADDRVEVLLTVLQGAHDIDLLDWDENVVMVAKFDRWASTMRTLASRYNLKTDTMDNALKEAGHDVPS